MHHSDAPGIPPVHTVPEAIAWWADATPDAPALLDLHGGVISYGQLQATSEAFARQVRALGIVAGDRIVLALPSDMRSAVAALAAIRVAVAAPVNPAQPVAEAETILGAIRPRAVIVAEREVTPFRVAARRAGIRVLELDAAGALLTDAADGVVSARHVPLPSPDAWALILLTSGTTARPRLVPASHQALFETCEERARIRRYTPGDRGLHSAPLHFVVGLSRIVEALIAGGSAIVATAAEIVDQPEAIRDLEPTWMWMGPPLLEAVLEAAREQPAFAEWPLRFVRAGGSQVTPQLIARGEALWGVPLLNGYGTTETMGYISAEEDPERIPRKLGSVGQARPGRDIAIRDADGAVLPAAATGEITVRGRAIFPGYLDDPEATAAVFFPGGWYRTGDLGYLDEDGYLFVTGRTREMVNRGGEKIAPDDVDAVLRTHPAVAAAAAFALPDPHLGEDIAVAVVLREGWAPTPRALRRWMLDRLTSHKVPRRIWFVTALPRTDSGKIQRNVLTERFRAHGDV